MWTRPSVVRAIEKEQRRLGARLRAIRTEQGISQQLAAELAGVHPTTMSGIERGKMNVTAATLVALALAYKVPLRSFFE